MKDIFRKCKKSLKKEKIMFLASIFIILIGAFLSGIIYLKNNMNLEEKIAVETSASIEGNNYIKWVENNLTLEVLEKASKLDIDSHTIGNEYSVKYDWIELIAYLACKNGNNFKQFKQKDLDNVIEQLNSGLTMQEITKDNKYYSYYLESYTAILKQFIGEYEIEVKNKIEQSIQEDNTQDMLEEETNNEKIFEKKYGLKAYLPIAKGYGFSHYNDFGNSRSYGFKRLHLGNDLMGSIGTPIIAVESGIVEAARMESIWRLENRNKKF